MEEREGDRRVASDLALGGALLAVVASSAYGLALDLDPGVFLNVLVLIGAGS